MEADMAINTTLNVHANTLRLLDDACALTGMRRGRIINMLIHRSMHDMTKRIRIGRSVQYQARDHKENWHIIHVRLSEDDADYLKDLRNVLKESDSLIIAKAARLFLSDIIKQATQGMRCDNYRFSNYVLSRIEEDGLIAWKIYWGYPKNPETALRL